MIDAEKQSALIVVTRSGDAYMVAARGEAINAELDCCGADLDALGVDFPPGLPAGLHVWEGAVVYGDEEITFEGACRRATLADLPRFDVVLKPEAKR